MERRGLDYVVLNQGNALLTELYRAHIGDWPKFFKMDTLSKAGFVASELLLKKIGERRCEGDEFIQKLSEKVGRQISYEEAKYGWLGYAKEVPMKRLHLLQRLRQEGYTVLLLSNTNPFMMEWTRSNDFCEEGRPITDFFDRIYCSYELKMYKPDPAFFRYVLNDADIKAEESLFIDDGQVNLDGAASVGLHTLLAKPDEDWTVELQQLLNVSLIK